MSKSKTVFVCKECGYESSGWLGKCPSCGGWNTFYEEKTAKQNQASRNISYISSKPIKISEINIENDRRYSTGIGELDRVLGGGIVKGSLILVGGDPGIGKSTLILQICNKIDLEGYILYVSGEESVNQIKLRADRLGIKRESLLMISETSIKEIEGLISEVKPQLVVVDSIQTMYSEEITSAAGSVSQVREITGNLMKIAKGMGISIVIVGHVTKEGAIAGPRVLEHMVDTVLYFEGERHMSYRILRSVKNRFGSTNEIGIFEMGDAGLSEVQNPSLMMLSGRQHDVPGSVVVASVEGTRPMLVEIQALVCATNFGMPRRMAAGVDYNRVTMLMAVLEKRVGLMLYNYDAYVNVVGGLKLEEPACDLGIICSIASSFKDVPLPPDAVVIGEVGLTGEIRAVSHIEKRIMEATRIGFKKCIIPSSNMKTAERLKELSNMQIMPVASVQEALDVLFV